MDIQSYRDWIKQMRAFINQNYAKVVPMVLRFGGWTIKPIFDIWLCFYRIEPPRSRSRALEEALSSILCYRSTNDHFENGGRRSRYIAGDVKHYEKLLFRDVATVPYGLYLYVIVRVCWVSLYVECVKVPSSGSWNCQPKSGYGWFNRHMRVLSFCRRVKLGMFWQLHTCSRKRTSQIHIPWCCKRPIMRGGGWARKIRPVLRRLLAAVEVEISKQEDNRIAITLFQT